MPLETKSTSHIRAIRLRDDLNQIANLIEICFSENIDAEGRDYIRNIRQTAANFSGFLFDNTTPENSSLPFHGYVWVEKGEIIGNLTLIPLRNRGKGSYFIANVAVHPEQRRRGIARQLTERAIQHVREHDGKSIFLQVRDDNPAAIQLYRDHGFEEYCRRTTWLFRSKNPVTATLPSSVLVTRREKEDWNQQKQWLEVLYPKDMHWNIPFRLERLEPTFSNWVTRLLNADYQRSWALRKHGRLIGTATVEHGNENYDYCWLATSPIWEDEAVRTLIPLVARKVLIAKRLAVNYPAGRGREAFQAAGMKELNTLLWMKTTLIPIREPLIA